MIVGCLILLICALSTNATSFTPGKPTLLGENRIVGGTDAISGQFPYQASLRTVNVMKHFCGGSIISNYWIMSAAHCTIEERSSSIVAIVGTHLLSSGGTTHTIAAIRNHESFNRVRLENDISLLRTTTEIIFGLNVNAIALINRDVQSGELLVSGWGKTSTNGPVPDNLKWLQTNAVSSKDCKELVDINFDTVCAYQMRGKGICFGDSGGPLVVFNEGVVGINSYVVNGCGSGFPDGFTSVYYHRNWILDIISS